jgi:hypothetical protein
MKPEITIRQFELIFQILSSVAEQFAHGPGKSCQFYNVIGAMILKKALKIDARPVMGAAFLRVNEQGDVITFAGEEDGHFFSSPDAFHCWIETPNHYIDFTSPEFDELDNKVVGSVPRKMFKKPKESMAVGPDSLFKPGDFFVSENTQLTQQLLQQMFSSPDSGDFANICLDWYNKSKKKVIPEMSIANDLGEVTVIILRNRKIQSAW